MLVDHGIRVAPECDGLVLAATIAHDEIDPGIGEDPPRGADVRVVMIGDDGLHRHEHPLANCLRNHPRI